MTTPRILTAAEVEELRAEAAGFDRHDGFDACSMIEVLSSHEAIRAERDALAAKLQAAEMVVEEATLTASALRAMVDDRYQPSYFGQRQIVPAGIRDIAIHHADRLEDALAAYNEDTKAAKP